MIAAGTYSEALLLGIKGKLSGAPPTPRVVKIVKINEERGLTEDFVMSEAKALKAMQSVRTARMLHLPVPLTTQSPQGLPINVTRARTFH